MIRRKRTTIAFYSFLVLGFFCLIIFTTKNVSAQLALIGVNYGDFLPFKEYFQNKQQLPKKITFVGDVMLARHIETLMLRYGEDYPFKKLSRFDTNDTYLVGNFEGSVPVSHVKTPDYNLNFSINSSYLSNLKSFGFTHFSLANNHSFDYGESGFYNTVKKISKNNLVPFGHPTIVNEQTVTFVDIEDSKVAIIGLHTLFSKLDSNELKKTFVYAEQNSDLQIVYLHWGDEYEVKQNKTQRIFANELINLGADLIVGHHPHVVQGIEEIDGVLVFYSLGNFIFDQYFSSLVKEGLMIELTMDETATIKLHPVISRLASSQPELMTKTETSDFLSSLAKRSSPKLQKEIISGELNLALNLQLSKK